MTVFPPDDDPGWETPPPGLPPSNTGTYKRKGTVTATRIFIPFIVNGRNFVESFPNGGWFCIGEDGSPFGVTVENFLLLFEEATLGSGATPAHTIVATIGPHGEENGTIAPSGIVSVFIGADQLFTITPNAGYSLAILGVDGEIAELQTGSPHTSGTYQFTGTTSNHTIEAYFQATEYENIRADIDISGTGSGGLIPSGITQVIRGEDQAFTMTPLAGSVIGQLLIDGESVAVTPTGMTYTFTDVTEFHELLVRFDAA